MQRNRCVWEANNANGPDVGLSRQKLQSTFINMFKELKETVFKEQNEGMITVSHKIEYQLRYRNYKKETNGNAGVRIEKYNE